MIFKIVSFLFSSSKSEQDFFYKTDFVNLKDISIFFNDLKNYI